MTYFALMTILLWPIIPCLWIPLHLFPAFFRTWGKWTYLCAALCWGLCALVIFSQRDLLLSYTVKLPRALATFGMVFVFGGVVLNIMTARLLTIAGITGSHELANRADVFRRDGVFSVVRHPTYLAHTIILLGIFFITRSAAVGLVALIDFILVHAVIIPLEERELRTRFGVAYEEYRSKVPKFFPTIRI